MQMRIYTDGGCSGNPGPGGWAYVIIAEKAGKARIIAEDWGAEKETTNNRMELNAAVAALERAAQLPGSQKKIWVFTDSQYVQKGMSLWIHSWKRNAWRTSDRKPVKNQELWRRLDELADLFPIQWEWVKGHAGNEYNERCDRMTRMAVASLETDGPFGPDCLIF
ncbi:MAG: ribonuclease HI [Treponema sp.]|jgi:ribonuclease HI|nr:ribonuclease HI [Treponema sp.]